MWEEDSPFASVSIRARLVGELDLDGDGACVS